LWLQTDAMMLTHFALRKRQRHSKAETGKIDPRSGVFLVTSVVDVFLFTASSASSTL
jgi:hypothetical protein